MIRRIGISPLSCVLGDVGGLRRASSRVSSLAAAPAFFHNLRYWKGTSRTVCPAFFRERQCRSCFNGKRGSSITTQVDRRASLCFVFRGRIKCLLSK